MNKIYKYLLPTKEKLEIDLPVGAKIIRVGDVEGLFYLWAIVNTEEDVPTEKRFLEFYKTGQPIKTPLKELIYLGECKLFIMQELCLYTFENVLKSSLWRTENSQKN